MKVRLILSAVLAAVTLVGCGGGVEEASDPGPSASPSATEEPADEPSEPAAEEPSPDAEVFARAVTDEVASAKKVTVITEDNDPNNLIGRPGGYLSAAVIHDEDGDQSDPEPGVEYGATVEVFEDETAAQDRSDYIQGILKDNPMLGTEYNYLNGAALLRVSGDIKPSVASQYEDAFMAAN
jgi:hypothetical protein